jgi:hypothetical protein
MFQIAFQLLRQPMGRIASLRIKAATSSSRKRRTPTAVCPPAARSGSACREGQSWREQLGHWIDTAWPGLLAATLRASSSKIIAGVASLRDVRHEFADSLRDIAIEHTGSTLNGIRSAHSLHELWHLRPEIFNLVARHRDQAEAGRRLALLNRHFPTRAPRSGFGALASFTLRDGER